MRSCRDAIAAMACERVEWPLRRALRDALRGRAGAAASAAHGRLGAGQAPSGVDQNWYRPWGPQGPLWGAAIAYGLRATKK